MDRAPPITPMFDGRRFGASGFKTNDSGATFSSGVNRPLGSPQFVGEESLELVTEPVNY